MEHERDFGFTDADFNRIRTLIHQGAGIALTDHKRDMVYSRVARRLRARGVTSFGAYLDLLERENSAAEWEAFTNALTTNLTSFFREAHHFPILDAFVRKRQAPVSVWCSASSTGEEPYSIAMTLTEALGAGAQQATVVASDIDTQVLAKAEAGVYSTEQTRGLGDARLRRFFLKGTGAHDGQAKVRPELRAMLRFARVNLTDPNWPVAGPFDAIFCRNVMIYFDKPTQGRILERFAPLLKPDGLLFAGHSENFTYVTRAFRLRGNTVYELAGAGAGAGAGVGVGAAAPGAAGTRSTGVARSPRLAEASR